MTANASTTAAASSDSEILTLTSSADATDSTRHAADVSRKPHAATSIQTGRDCSCRWSKGPRWRRRVAVERRPGTA
jgi:hypothetical protein